MAGHAASAAGGLGRRPAAEQAAQEAPRPGWLLRPRLALQLAHLLLQLLDAGIGLLQRVLLHQHRLHQHVGRIAQAGHLLVDQRLGLAVLLGQSEAAHAIEQAGDELAFFGGHVGLPSRLSIRAPYIVPTCPACNAYNYGFQA